jgi:hypothetical protein
MDRIFILRVALTFQMTTRKSGDGLSDHCLCLARDGQQDEKKKYTSQSHIAQSVQIKKGGRRSVRYLQPDHSHFNGKLQ